MMDHIFQFHQKENTNNIGLEVQRKSISLRRQSIAKSPFISQGDFLKEVESDPLYDYANMEYEINEKTKQKKILGNGCFGNVYLARNRKDHKLYAIKHVIFKFFKILD